MKVDSLQVRTPRCWFDGSTGLGSLWRHSPSGFFLPRERIIRVGAEPTRSGILTEISGRDFDDCHRRRLRATIDRVEMDLISLPDLLRSGTTSRPAV